MEDSIQGNCKLKAKLPVSNQERLKYCSNQGSKFIRRTRIRTRKEEEKINEQR